MNGPGSITDFEALLRGLQQAGVEFVVIGGLAATIHGSPRLTRDLDVVYARTAENIRRLVNALSARAPYLRGAPEGLPFVWDEYTIRMGLNFTLTTIDGSLDLLGEVPGGGFYADLLPHSFETTLFGIPFRCVDLPTLIRLKRAAGRPKDLEVIAELEALLQSQRPSQGK